MSDKKNSIENNFTYHKPFGTQPQRYEQVRAKAKEYAEYLVSNTPVSREQSLALTKLEEAVFWANAAIARNESDVTEETQQQAAA